jgi:hypothetical protein
MLDLNSATIMMISVVTRKKNGVLFLEWKRGSSVKVLVFINWNLYKKNCVQVFLSKRERLWP